MAKTSKRTKLSAKAVSRTTSTSKAPSTESTAPAPLQRTKDEKRTAKHDAFLKSISPENNLSYILEIVDKTSTKRKRPKKKKNIPNLLSLNSSLEDIISQDREEKSKKQEISTRLKGNAIKMELVRMKTVMEHPQFKVNPLKTIREHVQNTWEKKEGMA